MWIIEVKRQLYDLYPFKTKGQKVATLLSCRTYNSYSLNIDPLFTKFRVKKFATENNYREIQAKVIEIIIINILCIK